MFLSYAVGAVLVIWVLLRQMRIRPVPRVLQIRLPIIVGVVGLFEMSAYAGSHHVSAAAWGWVVGTMLVGAVGLGALRGLSVRVWASEPWVLRQGTALTMALWLLSLAVHFVGDALGAHTGGGEGLEGSSFLLYFGLTLGVQYAVVHRRALPLWNQLGPGAGQPLQVNFSQGPGMFFATFRGGGPAGQGPAGWGAPGAPHPPRGDDERDVIDAEVVDDDEQGPPQLPTPPR